MLDEFSLEMQFILCALAVWRLTHLLVAEDGPADFVVRLRAGLGDSMLGNAMDCFFCMSIWIAAPFALVVASSISSWFICWLALSGFAALLQGLIEPRKKTL